MYGRLRGLFRGEITTGPFLHEIQERFYHEAKMAPHRLKEKEKKRPVGVFLRWCGGKRWMIPKLESIIGEQKFDTYIEPFIGSGSFYLEWGHNIARRFILSDIDTQLIETFQTLKKSPTKVLAYLSKWPQNKTFYNEIRRVIPNGYRHWNAARFVYLNSLSWNGVNRTNQAGQFNVPYNHRRIPKEIPEKIRTASSRLLQMGLSLSICDYKKTLGKAREGDIVILDPPYVPRGAKELPNRCYTNNAFSWNDQLNLAKVADKLVKSGVTVIAAQSSCGAELYPRKRFQHLRFRRPVAVRGGHQSGSQRYEYILVGGLE